MNIDIKKLKEQGGFTYYDICTMARYEIKPVDCNECVNNGYACKECKHRKDALDMFEQKQNEFDKLFNGLGK